MDSDVATGLMYDLKEEDKAFLVGAYVSKLNEGGSLEDEMYNELERRGACDDEYYLRTSWRELLDNTVKERREMEDIFWIDALYEKLGISQRDGVYFGTREDGTKLRIYWHSSDEPSVRTKLDIAIEGKYHLQKRTKYQGDE